MRSRAPLRRLLGLFVTGSGLFILAGQAIERVLR